MQAWSEVGPSSGLDPYALTRAEVDTVSERLRHSVASHIPALKDAADYFFRRGVEGKRVRPTLLLLLASALSQSRAPPDASHLAVDLSPPHLYPATERRRQQRIAGGWRSHSWPCVSALQTCACWRG